MRKFWMLGLISGLVVLAGCATVANTGAENRAMQRYTIELEMRQLADDWNLIWMTDRPSRLTRWQTR